METLIDFSIKNIKKAFNEALPYITHFVVLYLFLKRLRILLTFIRHLTLIKSNLIKQKKKKKEKKKRKNILLIWVKFEQFHTFSAYSKLQCVFTYMYIFHFFTFYVSDLNILRVVTVVNFTVVKFFSYFLEKCIVYFVLYPVLMLHA